MLRRENDVFYRLCCLHKEAHKVPPSCFTSITRRGRLARELWPILNVSEPQRTVANICIELHLIHGPELNSSSVQQRPLLSRNKPTGPSGSVWHHFHNKGSVCACCAVCTGSSVLCVFICYLFVVCVCGLCAWSHRGSSFFQLCCIMASQMFNYSLF